MSGSALRSTVVLADLHLVRETPAPVVDDLVRLLETHAGSRVVFAGDLFDFSADPDSGVAVHPKLRAALARHVDTDGELWLVAGNHDARLGDPGTADTIADELGLVGAAARARVRSTPWFFREGALHIEHGHLHDPDNATAHPLVRGESLGVHFVERFIVPTGAHRYLNSNDGTPLAMFLSSFRWYGVRAPYVIWSFFRAAFEALGKSGRRFPATRDRAEGAAKLAPFAEAVGVETELARELADLSVTPTLASARATFARCYLDRVGATLALTGGASAIAMGRFGLGGATVTVGAATMLASWAVGHDRYSGSVASRLARAASRLAAVGDAKLVIMGHTHVEADDGAYANTGSFSFPRRAPGRPYLVVDGPSDAPRAERRYLLPRSP